MHSTTHYAVRERRGGAKASGLCPYPATLRQSGQCFLCRLPQPIRQLPPTLFLPGNDHRCQREGAQTLSLRGDEEFYEKLKSLPNASEYLEPDITFELLDAQASEMASHMTLPWR